MVIPVQGADPDKIKHRTYKTLEPKGEIAVVQRPEGTVKILFYTCSGATSPVIPKSLWTATKPSISPWSFSSKPTALAKKGKSNCLFRGRGQRLTGPTPPPAPNR